MKRRVSDLVVKPAGDDVGHKLGLAQRTIIRDVTQHYKTHLVKISRNPKLVGVSGKVSSNGRSGRICLGILLDRKIGNERCVRNGRSTRSEQLFDMKRCTRSKGQRESNVGGGGGGGKCRCLVKRCDLGGEPQKDGEGGRSLFNLERTKRAALVQKQSSRFVRRLADARNLRTTQGLRACLFKDFQRPPGDAFGTKILFVCVQRRTTDGCKRIPIEVGIVMLQISNNLIFILLYFQFL